MMPILDQGSASAAWIATFFDNSYLVAMTRQPSGCSYSANTGADYQNSWKLRILLAQGAL
jgi:hypothetical protein